MASQRQWSTYHQVPGPVHPSDTMLFDRGEERLLQYSQAGLSAKNAIETSLDSVGYTWSDIRRFLDLGCGYGRVLRHLVTEMAGAELVVCDIDREAVEFCAEAFEATGAVSEPDLEEVDLGRFDLIWSGSLITHLTEQDGDKMARLLGRSLNPSGIAVFSFHGRGALDFLPTHYGREFARDADGIRSEVARTGISYRSYASDPLGTPYGVTFHDVDLLTERLSKVAGLEVVLHLPMGWNAHHDVLAVRAGSESGIVPSL